MAYGVGVGIGTMDPTRIKTPRLISGVPGLCWRSLGLIALLIGSSVASRVAEAPYRHEGMLHGLLTWGVVMLCILCLPTTVLGNFMSGTLGTLAATAQTAVQASFGMTPAPLIGAMVAAWWGDWDVTQFLNPPVPRGAPLDNARGVLPAPA